MKKIMSLLLTLLLVGGPVFAQITIPHTFAPLTVISSSQMNTNFSALGNNALNRTGGTITGTITVSADVTIDGADISDYLSGGKLIATSTAADSLDVGGGINAGTGNVGIVDSTGKIPALTATYFTAPAVPSAQFIFAVTTQTNYTALTSDSVILASGASTITLFDCGSNVGRWLDIKKTDSSNSITVARAGSDTIDGATSFTLDVQYQSITLVCTGADVWSII